MPDPEDDVVVVVVVLEEEPEDADEDDPAALEDEADPEEVGVTAGVVILVEEGFIAFDPPHPVTAKAATASVPKAHNPFKFNCIRGPFPPVGEPAVRSK